MSDTRQILCGKKYDMKIFFAITYFILAMHGEAQELKFGLATNFAKLPYYTGGLDLMISRPGARWMALGGMMYTHGSIYGTSKAEIDPEYMIDKPAHVTGFGGELQLRYNLSQNRDAKAVIYGAAGAMAGGYRIRFSENEYIMEPSTGMYHYGLADYESRFAQRSAYVQLICSNNLLTRFIVEFGAGVAYNKPRTSALIDKYRDLGKDPWAQAARGYNPVFTFRLGYWIR